MGGFRNIKMKTLFRDKLFYIGLLVRIVLIIIISPPAVTNWYAPFIDMSLSSFSFDPWSNWVDRGGSLRAFPYGYAMWFAFLPIAAVGNLIHAPIEYSYKFSLLVFDLLMLFSLHKSLSKHPMIVLSCYWLSPIVIIATYLLGMNDLLPALLLMLSMSFLQDNKKLYLAGALCAAAISAKLSMVISLPFFLIYLYNNKSLRHISYKFYESLSFCILIFELPFFYSKYALKMILENPELQKIYIFSVDLGVDFSIFILPLVYIVVLYLVWRVRRLNFEFFQAIIGIVFLLIVLMTPAVPGWFIWSLPLLVLYQAKSDTVAIVIIGFFSTIYTISTLIVSDIVLFNGAQIEVARSVQEFYGLGKHSISLLRTMIVAVGVILVIRIWRDSISKNDYFRLSRHPFLIGIAGDSGAGKDTFVESLTGLFGSHSVVKLSGDDYHLWDRRKPMWQVMTHLNPMANDLERFGNDIIDLADGKNIQLRHYDHRIGKMTKPFKLSSNDIIIVSGLHALYLPIIRNSFNLKIFLDIDEDLRRHFKIKRDVRHRGQSPEQVLELFKKRELDSNLFIRPQSRHADLILSLIHPRLLKNLKNDEDLRLKLIVKTRYAFNELSLTRILVGLCGLHVDIATSSEEDEFHMIIEGEASAEDIEIAAKILCPRVYDFLDVVPKWQHGVIGLMQLVTISHVNQVLTKRLN